MRLLERALTAAPRGPSKARETKESPSLLAAAPPSGEGLMATRVAPCMAVPPGSSK